MAMSLSDIINGIGTMNPQANQALYGQAPPVIPGASPAAMAPNVGLQTSPQPLIAREQLAQLLQNALVQGQPSEQDKTSAIMNLGAAIAAPRNRFSQTQPQKYINALGAYNNDMQTAAKRAQAENAQKAMMALQMSQMDQAQQKLQIDLEIAKYNAQFLPAEKKLAFAKALRDLENAKQRNDINAQQIAMGELELAMKPESMRADLDAKKAMTAAHNAAAATSRASADLYRAKTEAETIDQAQFSAVKVGDNAMLFPKKGNGDVFMIKSADALETSAQLNAMKQAGATPEQLMAKQAELANPRPVRVGAMTNGVFTPNAVAQAQAPAPQQNTGMKVEDGEELIRRLRGVGGGQLSVGKIGE